MKLTEALKKSQVVRRASEPEAAYEVAGQALVKQGDQTREPVYLGLEDLNANDWQFQVMKWVGTKAKAE